MKSYDAPMPFTEISERYHPFMDAPVELMDGSYTSSLTLADRAYQHPYFGLALRTQLPRFAFYFDTNERTVEYLGTGADTIGHMYELGFHVAEFIEANAVELTDDERGILMLTLLVHDMDETTHEQVRHTCGRVVGDIKCGGKTDEDKAAQKRIREMLYREVLYDLPSQTIRRIEAITSHQDKTHLAEIFDICHELQTYETINNAEDTLRSGDFNEEDRFGLEELNAEGRELVVMKLRPYLGKFASLNNLILNEATAVA